MKKQLFILLITLFVFCVSSCKNENGKTVSSAQSADSAKVESQEKTQNIRHVNIPLSADFCNLTSVGRVDVVYSQDATCTLELVGDSALLSDVQVEIDSKVLTLGLKPDDHLNHYGRSPHITAYVTCPDLKCVSLCETGSFTTHGLWTIDSDVSIGAMGRGSFFVDSLCCTSFLYQSSGDDKSTFSYIKAPSVTLNATRNSCSSFNIDAISLYVELAGTSTMTVSGRADRYRESCTNSAKLINKINLNR